MAAAMAAIVALLVTLLAPASASVTTSMGVGVTPGANSSISLSPDSVGEVSWQVSCGAQDCTDAEAAVVLPWPLQAVLPEYAVPGRTETFDPASGKHMVVFSETLADGSQGLPAGAVRELPMKVRYAPDAGVVDGQRWDLTLKVTSARSAEVQGYASVIATVPPPPSPPAEAVTPAPVAPEPPATSDPGTTTPEPATEPTAPAEPGEQGPSPDSSAAPTQAPEVRPMSATIGVTKSASREEIRPGEEVGYTIVGSCSSLTEPCLNFTITDVLPAQFEVTSLPQSNSQRTVSFDAATRMLTIAYKIPVAGGVGLPAGSNQSVQIGMRLPQQTDVVDGTKIPNTASAESDAASPASSTVDVTAAIPVAPNPVATKTWSPNTAIAQSEAASNITLGVRNASSTSTQVSELAVADVTAATFNNFDITGVGPVVSFPPGADQVVVDVCQKPVGTPCGDGDWQSTGPQAGPALSLPGGVTAADVTGVRYRFSNSSGNAIPFSVDQGQVQLPVKLRNTDRTTGDPIEPASRLRVDNCADPSLVHSGTAAAGKAACAPFTIQPNAVSVAGAKTIFPDANGSYTSNGLIVVGQNSGVSMGITATNTSSVPVGTIGITEPATSGAEFDKINVTKGRITWPTGADSAVVTVICREGANPPQQDVLKTSSPQNLVFPDGTNFGCVTGFPAKVTVLFASPGAGEPPTIPPNAAGGLQLHGIAAGVTTDDARDALTNCADVTAAVPGGTTSATARPCASVAVANPTPAIGSQTKDEYGIGTIVPGQANPMLVGFRNSGNIPISNLVIEDPREGVVDREDNAFKVVYLDTISLPASPAATLQLWDPQKAGGAGYVQVAAGSAEFNTIKKRALGFRIVVTGSLNPGERYNVPFTVMLRDATTDPTGPAPDGTKFRNCAYFGIGAVDTKTKYCTDDIEVVLDGENAFNLAKTVAPGTVTRPGPGVPTQTVQVRHLLTNTGELNLNSLTLTDTDAAFFDAVTFAGRGTGSNQQKEIRVNYPPGAERAKIEVCTSVADCNAGTFPFSRTTTSSTPQLPTGVNPADVKGIRVTLLPAAGGSILPSKTVPTSAECQNATVCFNVTVREYLASQPTVPVPDEIADTSTGDANDSSGNPLESLTATTNFDLVEGTGSLAFRKAPNSRIGPGETAPLTLEAENTGDGALTGIRMVDPLPAGLTFDPEVPGAPVGQPYLIEYTLPAGVAPPTEVVFTQIKGGEAGAPADCTDPNRVCTVAWTFPGYALPPGGKITVTMNVTLTPGVSAGETVTNTGGAQATTREDGQDVPAKCTTPGTASGEPFGEGEYCTASAAITTLAGDDFQAQKWIKADPDLGFLNAVGQVVPVTDPQCPQYAFGGAIYTRYPCVARVLPGQTIDYLIRGVNSGTNPAKQIVLVDGLPVEGDNGVLLSGEQRGTEWNNRPTMASPVVNVDGYAGVTTGYTDAPYTSPEFCRQGIQPPPSTCPPGSFNASFGPGNTGFQTIMDFPDDALLRPGQSFTLTWSMTAPLTLDSASSEPVAWNSFAYRPTFKVGAGLNTLPAAEPLKVGVAMPLTTFSVTKEVNGLPAGVSLEPFEFAYACTIGETEIASGEFTIAGEGSWSSPSIPGGATCEIYESNSQGGVSSNPESDPAVVVVGEDESVAISNDFATAKFSVSKAVKWDSGVEPVVVPPAQIDVTCTFPTTDNVLPGFPVQVALADGESTEFTDLPVGSACQVTESNPQGASQVVIFPSNADPIMSNSGSVLIDDSDPSATVENLYETGTMAITKVITGNAAQWAQGPFEIDVDCTGPPPLPDYSTSVTLFPGQLETVISNIPANYTCAVTESSAGTASGTTITPETVTIPEYVPGELPPPPVEVTISNDFPAGYVTVAKELTGDAAGPMADAEFTIRVQCERVLTGGAGTQVFLDEEVKLKGGASTTLDTPLPVGAQCWLEETNSVGATEVSLSNDVDNKAKVTAEEPDLSLKATNTYIAGGDESGGIVINKSLTGEAAGFAQGPFVFETVCTLGGFTLPTYTTELSAAVLTGSISPIPVGASCTTTETDMGTATTAEVTTAMPVTVPAEEEEPIDVEAVNDFPAGYVSISKSVSGDAGDRMREATFVVDVTCEYTPPGNETEVVLSATDIEITDGESISFDEDPLPVGTECWAAETQSRGASEVTINYPEDSPAVVTAEALDIELTVDNRFDAGGNEDGSLRITKTLAGAAAEYAQGPFDVQVTCTLGDYEMPVIEVTIDPAIDPVAVVEDIPEGAQCSIVETDQGSASSYEVLPASDVAIPPAGDPAAEAEVVNDFPAGYVSVTKVVDGGAASVMAGAVFTVDVTCERDLLIGGSEEILSESLELTAGETVRIDDPLPIGARCWTKETNSVGATTVTQSNDADNPAVVEEAEQELDLKVTNTYTPGGTGGTGEESTITGVKIQKELTGGGAAKATGPFVFDVACEVGGFKLPTSTVTLTPQKLVGYVNPLPVGAQCTVTEVKFGNAQGPAKPVTVTVPGQQAAAVVATQVNTFAPEPPGPTPSPTNGGGSGTGGKGSPSLATTGVSGVERILLASLGLLAVGGLLLMWTRRRGDGEELEGEA